MYKSITVNVKCTQTYAATHSMSLFYNKDRYLFTRFVTQFVYLDHVFF